MNDREQFLYDNMQQLFNGVQVSNTFEGMFVKNNTINYFNSLREKLKEQIGGSVLSLITLKQYINDCVNNISPK